MAFVGIKIPSDVGAYLKQIPVPGTPEPEDHLHITMLYLGKKVDPKVVVRAGLVAYEVGQEFHEFECLVTHIASFPPGEDGVPIICPVESEVLHEFRARMAEAFDKNQIAFSKKHPDFHPHVTLSYSDKPMAEVKLKPTRWTVDEICIWGGDEGETKLVVKVPLSEGMVEWLL